MGEKLRPFIESAIDQAVKHAKIAAFYERLGNSNNAEQHRNLEEINDFIAEDLSAPPPTDDNI